MYDTRRLTRNQNLVLADGDGDGEYKELVGVTVYLTEDSLFLAA